MISYVDRGVLGYAREVSGRRDRLGQCPVRLHDRRASRLPMRSDCSRRPPDRRLGTRKGILHRHRDLESRRHVSRGAFTPSVLSASRCSSWAWAKRPTSRRASRPSPSGFPRRERALATGIFNSGANIGNIVTPILVPLLTLTFTLARRVRRYRRYRLCLAGVLALALSQTGRTSQRVGGRNSP